MPIIELDGGRDRGGLTVHFFALWTYGAVEIYFQWLMTKPGFEADEQRLELLRRVNRIPGVELPEDSITRRPSFPLAALAEDEPRRLFKEAIEWAMGEVTAAAGK